MSLTYLVKYGDKNKRETVKRRTEILHIRNNRTSTASTTNAGIIAHISCFKHHIKIPLC